MKVLIVDDDPVAVTMLDDVLSEGGHSVRSTGDWIGMMEALHEEHFEAVFLDVGLPGVLGTKLVGQISGIAPSTRVILYSGQPRERLEQLARQHGADGYLAKEQGVDLGIQILRRVCLSEERHLALAAGTEEAPSRPELESIEGAAEEVPPAEIPEPVPHQGAAPRPVSLPPIPATPEPEPEPASVPPWNPEAQRENPWLPGVVLIDSDRRRRGELESWFVDRGFGTHVASDFAAGLGALRTSQPAPDILLLDPTASGMDLAETVRQVREDPAPGDLVVIVIEAEGDQPSTAKGDGQGVDLYIRGPAGLERLPKFLSNRVRMLQWLRRLRLARDDLGTP